MRATSVLTRGLTAFQHASLEQCFRIHGMVGGRVYATLNGTEHKGGRLNRISIKGFGALGIIR